VPAAAAPKGRDAPWTDEVGSVSLRCLNTANVSTSLVGTTATLVITGGGCGLTVPAIYESASVDTELNGVTKYSVTLKILDQQGVATDLSKDAILGANDLNVLKVHVKEWGGDVYVRVMTVGEPRRLRMRVVGQQRERRAELPVQVLARCLCDKEGVRLFTDAEIDKLAGKSIAVVDRLFNRAMKHNAMSMEDVNELAGNERPAHAAVRHAAGRAPER
jgi:hypothetical protein